MTTHSTPPPAPTLQPIAELLARIALAPQQTHKSLTLWPLLLSEDAPVPDERGYVLLAHAGTASETDSYEDYIRSRESDLGEMLAAFRLLDRQVGFVAVAGAEIVGLEVIGRPEIFADRFEGLVRSYAVDAIDAALDRRDPGRERALPRHDSPEAFLAALGRAPVERGPSLGLGDDLRIEGEHVAGCALVAGQVVHLTAFPAQQAPGASYAG